MVISNALHWMNAWTKGTSYIKYALNFNFPAHLHKDWFRFCGYKSMWISSVCGSIRITQSSSGSSGVMLVSNSLKCERMRKIEYCLMLCRSVIWDLRVIEVDKKAYYVFFFAITRQCCWVTALKYKWNINCCDQEIDQIQG